MSSLISVVICEASGNKNSRDKGLIKSGGKTLAEIAYSKLKAMTDKVYISINQFQYGNYRNVFPEEVIIQNSVTEKGPLAGLFSVHKNMPSKDIFVLASDLPNIDAATLQKIFSVYKTNKNLYDFFVYKKQLNIEPLAGIYTKRGLEHIFSSYYSANIPRANLKFVLQNSSTYAIKVRDKDKLT
jgi:molybdopterin-guanine dinucleotide biosynthesis protein A